MQIPLSMPPQHLLKTGTGSEQPLEFCRGFVHCREVPVPFFNTLLG